MENTGQALDFLAILTQTGHTSGSTTPFENKGKEAIPRVNPLADIVPQYFSKSKFCLVTKATSEDVTRVRFVRAQHILLDTPTRTSNIKPWTDNHP